MNDDANPEADAFTAEVCWHYYVNELTQAEIARVLGATRLRVNQAIQRARAGGMVRIEIDSPFLPRLDLQDRLQRHFGLERVQVAPAHPVQYDYHTPVGTALASYMSTRLRAGAWKLVGVSWGETLQRCIERMLPHNLPEVAVISMLGGTSRGETLNAFAIASGFAARLGARYSLLAAPIFLADRIDRAAFLEQDVFVGQFEKFTRLDAAILTASNISDLSYLVRTGLPGGISAAELIAAGAVGDVVGRFLDDSGKVVSSRLEGRTIGIALDVLRQVPERVLAAAGGHKVPIIRAVLGAGIANVLVTDDVTARLLLEEG